MVFNATFNNISVISWRSVLLVEEAWVPGAPIYRKSVTNFITYCCIEYTSSAGLTLEGDLGEEVALWRLTSLSHCLKEKFKSPCNFEESPYKCMLPPAYFLHLSFMKMSISCTCLLKSIVSVIKYFESDFLGQIFNYLLNLGRVIGGVAKHCFD
jgi:hypothetical protein